MNSSFLFMQIFLFSIVTQQPPKNRKVRRTILCGRWIIVSFKMNHSHTRKKNEIKWSRTPYSILHVPLHPVACAGLVGGRLLCVILHFYIVSKRYTVVANIYVWVCGVQTTKWQRLKQHSTKKKKRKKRNEAWETERSKDSSVSISYIVWCLMVMQWAPRERTKEKKKEGGRGTEDESTMLYM